jgi:hypothetical protein
MKIKINELVGRTLDWVVCVAEGNSPTINPFRFGSVSYGMYESELGYAVKQYSSDWAQGGPIIEREKISVVQNITLDKLHPEWDWRATKAPHDPLDCTYAYGPTPIIAAMRCYVASKLGDTVDVPDELK